MGGHCCSGWGEKWWGYDWGSWWRVDLSRVGLLLGWGRAKYWKVSKLENAWKLRTGFADTETVAFRTFT